MSETITADQQCTATVEFTDKYNNQLTAPPGVPSWSVDNTAIVAVNTSEDATGMTAILSAVGPVGTANVSVTLDNITGTAEVTVTPGALSAAAITFATPVAKS